MDFPQDETDVTDNATRVTRINDNASDRPMPDQGQAVQYLAVPHLVNVLQHDQQRGSMIESSEYVTNRFEAQPKSPIETVTAVG